MSKIYAFSALAFVAIAGSGFVFKTNNPQSVVKGGMYYAKPDDAMAAAKDKAYATLGTFFAANASRAADASGHAVKIRIEEGRVVENIWMDSVRRDGDMVIGRIANKPANVTSIKANQEVRVPLSDVVDWMYFEGKNLRGNFTLCAMVNSPSAAQDANVQKYRSVLVDCPA